MSLNRLRLPHFREASRRWTDGGVYLNPEGFKVYWTSSTFAVPKLQHRRTHNHQIIDQKNNNQAPNTSIKIIMIIIMIKPLRNPREDGSRFGRGIAVAGHFQLENPALRVFEKPLVLSTRRANFASVPCGRAA